MTKETSNGETQSSPYESRIATVENELDSYEQSIGLPQFVPSNETEVQRLLSLPHDLIMKLTAEQCGEAALTLSQFALHLQRAANRLQSRIRMCESSIKNIIVPRLSQTKGASADERKLLAIANDDVASKIDKTLNQTMLKLDRLAFLSHKVENYAREFSNLYHSKKGKYNG